MHASLDAFIYHLQFLPGWPEFVESGAHGDMLDMCSRGCKQVPVCYILVL